MEGGKKKEFVHKTLDDVMEEDRDKQRKDLRDNIDIVMLEEMGGMSVAEKEDLAQAVKARSVFCDEASEAAVKIFKEKTRAILSGELKVGISYEDPDVTPLNLKLLENRVLMYTWNEGFDYQPWDPRFSHLSTWMKAIFFGNYRMFKIQINGLTKEELEHKLEMRESLMKRSAIFHVILGVLMLHAPAEAFAGHIKILEEMLNLGARVNVHDVSGRSPLDRCLVTEDKDKINTCLIMARMLLEKGANPNIHDRMGKVPLMSCVGNPHGEGFVRLLLDYGADPKIENSVGMSPLNMSTNYPAMEAIFTAFYKKDIKKERKAAKDSDNFKKCLGCNSSAAKRCSGCYMAWYCGADCQQHDWTDHKESCKTRRKEYLVVDDSFNSWSGIQSSSYQVVRIKISYDGRLLHIRNKEKSINGANKIHVESSASVLYYIIKSKGFKGAQGYFSSFLKKGVLSIHPTILPPETW